MSASSARRRRLSATAGGWAAIGLAWSLLAGAPALAAADQGAPTSLVPTPLTPPSGLSAPAPASSTAPATDPSGARGDRIEVRDLSAPDANATGVYDDAHGGFGSDMWSGTQMAVVQKVLPLVPGATPWRSLGRLERKLLLSIAAVPAGKASGESLLKLRADRLWALGDVDGLSAFLKGVPDQALTPELRNQLIDAALIAGDVPTACQQGAVLKNRAPGDIFAAKLQVFCQFSAGKGNEAGLGVDLLREQKIADAGFFTAADALGGVAPGKLESFAASSALTLAMARLAKLPLPDAAVTAGLSPAFLRAIATDPTATLEARLAAAERAEAVGAVDTEVLRQLFEQVTFTPQELAGSLGAAGTDKGVRSRALLYRAALEQVQPPAKAEVIGRALTLAGDGPAYFAAARLYANQIGAMHPAPDLTSFTAVAIRALLAAGRPDLLPPWLAALRGTTDPSGAAVAAGLWPLLHLAGVDGGQGIPAGVLAGWRKARVDLPGPAAARRGLVGLGLLAAMGDKVPSEDWLPLYDQPPAATPAASALRPLLWQGLRTAAEDLRLGETVMFALATLADGTFTQGDPTDLYRVVAALRLIGLEGDARSIAVEAAIANGV
jgi:hypothetical protein